MALVTWDVPCKSCFHKGTFAGFTLTLDGDCEDCHKDRGEQEFQKKVRIVREELKKALSDAGDEAAFFSAYSKAKAAGVSEAVVKKIFMQHQSNTEGIASPKEKTKTKRSAEMSTAEASGKRSRSADGLEADQGSTVRICVGLGGAEVSISIKPGMSIEDVSTRVRESFPQAASIKFSACGNSIASLDELLKVQRDGEAIYAIFVKEVDDLTLEEVQAELAITTEEFRGHLHILSTMARRGTTADVVRYLWDEQLLLTPEQAQEIFDKLLPKVRRAAEPGLGRDGPRAQLLFALHSFCLDPYAVWEPNDDSDDCLWASFHWGRHHIGGNLNFMRGRVGHLSSSSSSEQRDVCNLRAVLRGVRRNEAKPLELMTMLSSCHCSGWRKFR